jgi:hypothetical protein
MEESIVGRRCGRCRGRRCGSSGRDWALYTDGGHRIATGNNVNFGRWTRFFSIFYRGYFIAAWIKGQYGEIACRVRSDNLAKIPIVTAHHNLSPRRRASVIADYRAMETAGIFAVQIRIDRCARSVRESREVYENCNGKTGT